jgi:UDP-N-acetylmuramoyl-tripeptide--D-alanyl-D-alanine ligase
MTPIEKIYNLYLKFPRISTDSRKVIPDSIFFAMKGDHFNGNLFATEALDKGAAFAVIDDPSVMAGNRFILVPDALEALQKLAILHRDQTRAKIIGITGSNGKTTTKELIGKVLASTYRTVITPGNLNNHIGVPLTVLAIRKDTSFAVVEMGANHPGEIANLCKISRPDYGLITNIGKAHLEGFGSFEGVVSAKSELYDFIRLNKGLVFLNLDNQLLQRLSEGMKISGYGSGENSDCQGRIAGKDPYLSISWSAGQLKGLVRTMLFGDYNFENVMAAISIGLYFGVSPEQIEKAIGSYIPDNNRSQVMQTGRNTLVLDAYNANPSSMKASLINFHNMEARSRMIILGDMMELGEHSLEEHKNMIALTRKLSFDKVFFIGELFSMAARDGKEICFADINEAMAWFRVNPVLDMTILLKGSRKMQLEQLTNLL